MRYHIAEVKNGKGAGEDEATGEMIKSRDKLAEELVQKLRNKSFESGVVQDN